MQGAVQDHTLASVVRKEATARGQLPVEKCLLCGSTRLEIAERLSPAYLIRAWQQSLNIDISSELGDVREVVRYRCMKCELEFYDPGLAGSASLYAQLQQFDWYYMPHKWEHTAASKDIMPGTKVLEVGSGTGGFVEWVSGVRQVEALGLELNARAVSEAARLGRRVEHTKIEELCSSHREHFDVVCAFQVLEHLSDPRSFLLSCLEVLKPSGRLILAVPNSGGFIRRDEADLLNRPPHHVTWWTQQVLQRLAEFLPMRLTRLRYEPLASYHTKSYVRTWLQTSPRPLRLLTQPLAWTLRTTRLRRFLRGHTVYSCFTKDAVVRDAR
jgi:2-polyprenyl-3-methyl-5-hydroxy-6-metoxy-1,4-benzoquinol methylase